MLRINYPNFCKNEQQYIFGVIFGEFLEINFESKIHSEKTIEITNDDHPGKLILDPVFFKEASKSWLKEESMPNLPLKTWEPSINGIKANLIDPNLPILFGNPGLIVDGENLHLNVDIFGSSFFMLSRYEELIVLDRDSHNRFAAESSIAFKAGFLDRPIINEYLEILKWCLNQLWADLEFKEKKSSNFITCDVDVPFDPSLHYLKHAIRKTGNLLIKQKKPVKAFLCFASYIAKRLGFNVNDACHNAIYWMMDVNERAGNTMAFYFIMHRTSNLDAIYDKDFKTPQLRRLFKEISRRGHEIGIHPGYETFNNPSNFKTTVLNLRKLLNEEGIHQKNIGGRQHFLRWDASKTPQLWNESSLAYDSTLSFADKAGFRCGVCYEFTMYDLINRKKLALKQRPLIVMECSIIAPRYEGLGYSDQAMKRFMYFKNVCYQFNGSFALLWHNSHFENSKDNEFYIKLIS